MPKISALPELNTPASADVMPIVDVSESETNKITIANLLDYFSGNLILGDVLKPADISMFTAYKSANQSMTSATPVRITFPNRYAEYRNETNYNTTNSYFVAPYAGWLEISLTVSFSEGPVTDDTNTIGFRKNGTIVRNAGSWTDNLPGWSAAGRESVHNYTTAIPVAAGDQIDCYYDGISGGSGTIIMAGSVFSGKFTRDFSDI